MEPIELTSEEIDDINLTASDLWSKVPLTYIDIKEFLDYCDNHYDVLDSMNKEIYESLLTLKRFL